MSVLDIYKQQSDIIESSKYKNYIKNLELFYDNSEKSNNFNKNIDDDGNYVIIDKKNKANIITIKKSNIIDLNSYYDFLNNKINNIYNSISLLINDLNKDNSLKKKTI